MRRPTPFRRRASIWSPRASGSCSAPTRLPRFATSAPPPSPAGACAWRCGPGSKRIFTGRIPFEIAVRLVGPPKPQPPHAPGPMALRDPDYLCRFLGDAGFADIAVEPRGFHVIGRSVTQEAEIAGMLGPSGRLLDEKEADEATRRAVVKEAEAALAAYAGANGEVRLPGTVLLAKA